MAFTFDRLQSWAEKAIERNGTMEYITKYSYAMYTNTRKLARLKAGFLLKDILERFKHKIGTTLRPNRQLWLYTAHDYTLANILNALGLFEVKGDFAFLHFDEIYILIAIFSNNSYTYQTMPVACTLNCIKIGGANMSYKYIIETMMKSIQILFIYLAVVSSVHLINFTNCMKKLFLAILI